MCFCLNVRFNAEIETEGYVDRNGQGHCISPLLYETGWIPFDISTDGVTYNRHGAWLSGEHTVIGPGKRVTGYAYAYAGYAGVTTL